MIVWRNVNLNIKEAQLLADLYGIDMDLKFTEAFCDLLIKELRDSNDIDLLEALTTATLVKYARSFKKGVRCKIPENLLKNLSPELQELHYFCIDLRDKYIAHSVNAFEENQVVAYLVPEEKGPKGVSWISVWQSRRGFLGTEDVNKLKNICAELRKNVTALIEAENSKVLELSRKIPVEELYNQKDPPPIAVTKKDVKKSRKSHGK